MGTGRAGSRKRVVTEVTQGNDDDKEANERWHKRRKQEPQCGSDDGVRNGR